MIKTILRNIGALGSGETPSTEDYTNCSEALNILIKSWAKKGLVLWVTQEVSLPLVVGNASYQIGPSATGTGALVMSKPLKILQEGSFIRDSSGNDATLLQISRQEYDVQGSKSAAGTPNQFYYDVGLVNGTLYLLNVPNDATKVVHLQIQRQFYDMTSSSDNFDFPQEWFQALKWGGSAELAAEYGVSEKMIPYFEGKAKMFEEECFGFSVEEASTMFTVDTRGGR
jgi:hypothetical protein